MKSVRFCRQVSSETARFTQFWRSVATAPLSESDTEIEAYPTSMEQDIAAEEQKTEAQKQASLAFMDPFESLPLSKVATYLGEKFSPGLEEIKKAEDMKAKPKKYTQVVEPPVLPHFLPLTRWAANSPEVRETLIVDDQQRQRPRLSWYHPDDSMVPRGWLTGGLWEDLRYYRPFMKNK